MKMQGLRVAWALGLFLVVPRPAMGQNPIHVPLRVDGGRMIVEVEDSNGRTFAFVLGLSTGFVTESGRAAIAGAVLSLGGVPIPVDEHQTVPDDFLGHDGSIRPSGVIGGAALVDYDLLIDAPAGRLLLKPSARSVRWPGYSLSNPVSVSILHGYLIRTQVQIGETVADALLDLGWPTLEVSPPLAGKEGVETGTIESFRMGYSGWPRLPATVALTPTVRAWGGESRDFVHVGAPVALDCVIAVSWRHGELRTCLR